ncbi:MAG: UDP-glucose 4-epimerase [Candidatus Rokubacteria bacterium RIFCSPHIGHO2_12_FULL_73_22]|nr:MAG: UDP-glucose 4-epimerase [Candidatus Rokubacteria bacterium RIFCSPHIGHO2_02_FULL_73_26]OGL04626.1 MAG: UDP-glucose 4-epimerase [Candidatus Rokubacteria bacterium RIFCSPHIGHO2_12_FULL_73_22]OGL10253.1 MAG: UDP-glucose 4-epimerase [Candidatus Rokubacteria bacterium RIFCSPLOWO2_02_FULL_73_56]OGL28169.1 MAG: UDP-glucose 4-epimerase [Candidatus Rokubacteria bacterium RIFCSPLOWO2_12_FULL_73_47]
MRVLVTGGAGFVGSHAVDRLVADGHEVHVLDNLSTGRRGHVNARARLHVRDIRSPRLGETLAAARPEAVVHLAAQASVARSVADPVHDASVNVLGTIALLEACRRTGVRRVVYTSTGGAAYGDTDVLPTPEDHPLRPASPYGASKVSAERWLACWTDLTGGRALALRLANVYGPRQDPAGEAGVVAIFASRLLAGVPCVVNGDGEQTRDYVYVEDVADALARALAYPELGGAVNVATGVATSVNDLYRRLAALAGVARVPEHGPPRPGEQRRSVLDPARAKARLGWTPATPLDAGLATTLAWFRKEVGR